MHSLLRLTVLCVALTLPVVAVAQNAGPTSTNTPSAAAPSTTPAAPPPTQSEAKPVTVTAADTAKPVVAAGKIGAPPEGKGQVVFFRPLKFMGAAIVYKVREGDTVVGKLSTGRYFVHVAEPGTHVYNAKTEAKDALTMEVEAGETYYVQGTISMGFMVGHPNIAPSDQATFDGMADKLKPAE